jgi:putative phosphotransacetylase
MQLYLGIDAPVRISGDTKGSASCLIIGPKGVLNLQEGVIRAWRHVHMFGPHARKFGVRNGDLMGIRVISKTCSVMFEDVMVRIIDMPMDARRVVSSKGIKLGVEVHLDTDEGNACELRKATRYELLKQHGNSTSKVWKVVLADVPSFSS